MGILDRMLGRTAPGQRYQPAPSAQPLFAVIDVETTGLSPDSCRVLEMAVVLTDPVGSPVWEWSSRFNPEGPVGPTHVHGITGEDVASAPLIRDWLPYISQALAGRVVVAHNASFDLAFVRAEYGRAGWDMPWLPSICTMQAGRVYLPSLPRHRLGDCCEACGVAHEGAHSALGDARATAGVLSAYLTRTPDRGAWLEWESASAEAARLLWPEGPSRAAVAYVPDPYARRWANIGATKPTPPALVEAVRSLDLGDALDEGAPEGSLEYLELLADVLEDGVLDPDERVALDALSRSLLLETADVEAAHRAFLLSLAHTALDDGKVSRAEKAELDSVATALGLDKKLVANVVDAAEAARDARLSEGLGDLPPDWTLGEPLRVGDKIVFTGCEAHNRDALEARATRLGVRVIGNVSRRVALLVSDGTMDGTKAADARALGTRIVHPSELVVLLDHLQPALPRAVKATAKARPVTTSAGSPAAKQSQEADAVLIAAAPPAVPPGVIRAWARVQGYEVGERGRLHSDVIAAFHRAHEQPQSP
jgi:DNA polymerase-3 subunit epsilon